MNSSTKNICSEREDSYGQDQIMFESDGTASALYTKIGTIEINMALSKDDLLKFVRKRSIFFG